MKLKDWIIVALLAVIVLGYAAWMVNAERTERRIDNLITPTTTPPDDGTPSE